MLGRNKSLRLRVDQLETPSREAFRCIAGAPGATNEQTVEAYRAANPSAPASLIVIDEVDAKL